MSLTRPAQRHLWRPLTLLVCLLCSAACLEPRSGPARLPFEPVSLQTDMASLSAEAAQLKPSDLEALERFRTQRLAPLLLSEAELLSLLQPKGGAPSPKVTALITRYQTALAPAFLKEAPAVLAHAQRAGLTQVKVSRVGPSRGAQNTPGDLKLLEALPQRPPLYHVRYLPQGEGRDLRGLRLNGFVYTSSGWKTLLKLGESLEAWRAGDLKIVKG